MLTFDTLQPALECPDVFEHQQVFFQVAYALLNPCDVAREIAYDSVRRYVAVFLKRSLRKF
jgi:hypothetical protein